MVDDEVPVQERRHDQGGDPRPGSPQVMRSGCPTLARRHRVVPLAAELVVGDHDHRVLAAAAVVDRLQEVDQVVAAAAFARVAGVLVLEPDRFDEAHRVELAALGGAADELVELCFIPQVRAAGSVWRKACVVVQRLVVELEDLVRAIRKDGVGGRVRVGAGRAVAVGPTGGAGVAVSVRPATRVPGPAHSSGAELVTDRRASLRRQLDGV